MATVVSITNQKGGVGKTTTALAMHDALKSKGFKVLLIDTDVQKSSTKQFGARVEDEYTLYDVLTGECGIDTAIQHTERGDIVAADTLLGRIDALLEGMKKHLHLKQALKNMKSEYDFVLLDCPPALNTILLNNLTASHKVIVPITCEIMSLEGLVELSQTISDVKDIANPNLEVSGLLLIKYKKNTNLTKQLTAQMGNFEELFETKTFETKIRESVKQSEAHTMRQSVFEYAPKCTTAVDYNNFIDEFLGGC